jgi:hypothetical protein
MLVGNASGEIDRDVYEGRKKVETGAIDMDAYKKTFDRADAAD